MGAFSDNFYSWLDRQFSKRKVVMDAMPNGYKHPDGKPCHAKSIDTCPFFRKDMAEAEDIDNLNSATPSYDRKLAELEALYKDGGLSNIPALANLSFDSLKKAFDDFLEDLETYENGEHEVKWHNTQKKRDEIYEANKDKYLATIDPNTGKEKDDCSGFGVTFHTTLSNASLTPEEYDAKVTELCALGNVDSWNVGIFQKEGEISIDCKDGARAIAMMLHWNQNSTYNYKSGYTIYNLTYDEKENPGLERGTKRVSNE